MCWMQHHYRNKASWFESEHCKVTVHSQRWTATLPLHQSKQRHMRTSPWAGLSCHTLTKQPINNSHSRHLTCPLMSSDICRHKRPVLAGPASHTKLSSSSIEYTYKLFKLIVNVTDMTLTVGECHCSQAFQSNLNWFSCMLTLHALKVYVLLLLLLILLSPDCRGQVLSFSQQAQWTQQTTSEVQTLPACCSHWYEQTRETPRALSLRPMAAALLHRSQPTLHTTTNTHYSGAASDTTQPSWYICNNNVNQLHFKHYLLLTSILIV